MVAVLLATKSMYSLLTIDPHERWSAEEVLKCKWMIEDGEELARNSLVPNQKKMIEFTSRQKLKAAIYAVIGMNRLQFNGEDSASAISEGNEDEEPEEEATPPEETPPAEEESPPPEETPPAQEETPPAQETKPPEAAKPPEETKPPEEAKPQPPPPAPKKELTLRKLQPTPNAENIIATRDVYAAFNVEDCADEPYNKDFFGLAKKTAEFYESILKDKFPGVQVEVNLRKSLFNASMPNDEYNVYVEWDILATFPPGQTNLPTRRELCKQLVMANMEKYILDYVHPLTETAFARVTNVMSGHFAC